MCVILPTRWKRIDRSTLKGSEKVFFGIYKESGCGKPYPILYFTELDEHERDAEMSESVEGETIYTGFLKEARLDQGKHLLADNLARWNVGTSPIIEDLVSSISSRLRKP